MRQEIVAVHNDGLSPCADACHQQCENKDGLAAEAQELAGGFTLSGRIVYHSSNVYAIKVKLSR